MLRTGQLHRAPPRPRDLARRRGPRYRGPWRLPGPDSHRLAAVSLALGYTSLLLSVTSAPELLDAHSRGIIHDCSVDWLQLASLAAQLSGGGKVVLADADPRPRDAAGW
jgi:hypothetical protein